MTTATNKQTTTARINALEQGQQTILDTLAQFTSVITGLQTTILSNGNSVPVPKNCWHGFDSENCRVCDTLRDLFSKYDVVPNDFDSFMSELAPLIVDRDYLDNLPDTVEDVPSQRKPVRKAAASKPAPKTAVSQGLAAVLESTAKRIVANRKDKTFCVNDKILAASGPDDVRIYLTSAQHRTFRLAWKAAGMTLRDAVAALADITGPNPA